MLLAAMPRVEQRRLLRFFTAAPGVLGILVAVRAAVELLLVATRGVADTPDARLYVMPPVTAVSLILAGLSLTIAQRRQSSIAKWTSRVLALVVAVVGI